MSLVQVLVEDSQEKVWVDEQEIVSDLALEEGSLVPLLASKKGMD